VSAVPTTTSKARARRTPFHRGLRFREGIYGWAFALPAILGLLIFTAGPILGTLAELAGRPHVDFKGVYDRTQMREVLGQWAVDPHAGWKAPAFTTVAAGLPFASKVTTPYAAGRVHDYMHAKLTVVDDIVLTGSYNLSHSGEENAENLLELISPPLADQCAAFIDRLYARYSAVAK